VTTNSLPFRLEEVSLRYGETTALSGVALSVEAGEVLAVIGSSGAGKTSLLRLLNGSAQPTVGEVQVGAKRISTLNAGELRSLRASIGHIPQDFALIPNLRVVQNVIAGRLGQMGIFESIGSMIRPRARQVEAVHAILDRLGIEEKLFHRVDSLSGGQQQRVSIARALFQDPGALLADEPLASLDPARARETLGLLMELASERGLTLVMSLHDIQLARDLVPRLVGLRQGRIVFDRPAGEITDEMIEALYHLGAAEMSGER
jgi:phosphonate transport system ATP-binding protein